VVEAATQRVQAYGGTLTEAEMIGVLRDAGWPESAIPEALSVARCESRFSPFAVNGGNFGLYQINETSGATIRGPWFTYWGLPHDLWSDAVTNARVALWIWQMSRWSNWSCRP
jgi:hypothetical protein